MSDQYVPLQCEHIRDSGLRCGSPAMRGLDFCYYHRRLHDTNVLPGDSTYVLPVLESEHAVEMSVTHIIRAMLKGKIGRAEALVMFAGIRIAQNSIRHAIDPSNYPVNMIETDFTPAMERITTSSSGTDCLPVVDIPCEIDIPCGTDSLVTDRLCSADIPVRDSSPDTPVREPQSAEYLMSGPSAKSLVLNV